MGIVTIAMQLLPEGELKDHAILTMQSKAPLMKGHGTVNYACPICGLTILQTVSPRYYSKLAVRCGGCNTVEVVPAAPGVLT